VRTRFFSPLCYGSQQRHKATEDKAVMGLGDFACACVSDLAIIYSLFRMVPATQANFKIS
jgi:hypothetical protein